MACAAGAPAPASAHPGSAPYTELSAATGAGAGAAGGARAAAAKRTSSWRASLSETMALWETRGRRRIASGAILRAVRCRAHQLPRSLQKCL